MNPRINLLTILLLLMVSSALPAQRWREMWAQPHLYTPLEVKAAFDAYYPTHQHVKGDGCMQFQRYWQFVGPRLGKNGEFVDAPLRAYEARREYEQAAIHARTAVNDGNWYDISADIGHFYDGTVSAVGRVSAIAFHPTLPNVMYIGTPVAGIWRTIDHGASWAPLTSDEPFWGVCALAIDPSNGNTIYALTGDDFGATKCTGLFKSTDGGTNWVSKSPPLNYTTGFYAARKVLIDPTNSNIVYAAIAGDSAGLYKSTNAGDTWTPIFAHSNIQDVEFHPANPSILYLCSTQSVWRTTNAGGSWGVPVQSFPAVTDAARIGVTPANANYVYVFAGGPTGAGTFPGFYRSTNSGVSWTLRSSSPNIQEGGNGSGSWTSSWWSLGLAVSPTNANLVHAGSLQEWSSSDGGVNWTIHDKMDPAASPIDYCHSDCHFLTYNNGKLYYGNDGGLYYSTNEGTNWIDISNGLHITDIYKSSSSEIDPCLVVLGAQEASTNILRGPFPASTMTLVWGGDGMDNAIDPTNPSKMYFSGAGGGGLAYNAQGGLNGEHTSTVFTPNNLGPGDWVTPIQLNPLKPSTVLTGRAKVGVCYKRDSLSWVDLSGTKIPDTIPCKDVKFAPNDTMAIYAVKPDNVYRTTNYGVTWTNITSNLGTLGASSFANIAIHPTDKQHIFLACTNWSSNKKVFESTNGGSTWTNMSGTNLPNVPANCLVYQTGTADGLYLGTDAGVFYRDDTTGTWQPFSDGLPYVAVNDLDIVYATKKLRAATTGRGMWETNLWGVVRSELLNLTGNVNTTIVNEAYGQISSNQVLSSPADVTYRSATGVLLTTGFRVNAGAKLLATVSPCMAVPVAESTAALPPPVAVEPPQPEQSVPQKFNVRLAPNPTDARATLHMDLPQAGAFDIEVYDLSMRRIWVQEGWAHAAGSHQIDIATDKWPAGSYLILVHHGLNVHRQKLVIQH